MELKELKQEFTKDIPVVCEKIGAAYPYK